MSHKRNLSDGEGMYPSTGQLNQSELGSEKLLKTDDVEVTKLMGSTPMSPTSIARVAQPSPKIGDRNYNRMKYYSSLKTDALRHRQSLKMEDKG